MTTPVQLDENYFVAPQIFVEDLSVLKEQGFTLIVNNRPDGEAEDQPNAEQLEKAAKALGLKYAWNPIELPKLAQEHLTKQSEIITPIQKTLAFCRTGTRSSVLWVLMENAKGRSYADLVSQVSAKGFDLSRCESAMIPLKGQ
ncbi:TIGR01244 family sulfur transferase [Marinomonas sp. THO17]|uniref:TIGR01244 family sulfur transferase n=1 Tax=Marinomonas sp. THO17 TaxID=3149048 RepID=UPI00336BD684